MVRTRDFFLFVLCALFLVIAIGATWTFGNHGVVPASEVEFGTEFETYASATTPVSTEEADRANRVKVMRDKILASGDVIAMPETVEEESKEETPTDEAEPVATSTAVQASIIQTCPTYAPLTLAWDPSVIKWQEREGVRLVVVPGAPMPGPAIGSSTASTSPVAPDYVRAQLPVRTWPLPTTACLPTDVVGITMSGVLMRNYEQARYTGFGKDMLIGYALDGFPIYGADPSVVTDTCGGSTVGGTYRYTLHPDRPGLITCFAGVPATLR
jgi:hypothetical protein